MTLRYKILLITSCISFSLHAMEQKSVTHDSLTTNIDNIQKYNYINDLYKRADTTLNSYNPTDIQSIVSLMEIITRIKELKTHNIQEQEIGKFAYQQETSITNKVFSMYGKPYNGPLYTSIFFEKIARYNALLIKNQFTSPTLEQFKHHINNKKIKEAIDTVATNFRLFIDLDKLNSDQKILFPIPISSATHEFEQLTNDIIKLRETSPETIKIIADILYRFDIKKDQ